MAGIAAFGTKLRRNGVEIADVTNIGLPGLTREIVDTTHHNSPDRWREFIKIVKDGGEVTLDLNYNPTVATHSVATGLLADFVDDTSNATYDIVFPNAAGTVWSFPGIVTSFSGGAPIDDKLTASVTIKVAGKPTLV